MRPDDWAQGLFTVLTAVVTLLIARATIKAQDRRATADRQLEAAKASGDADVTSGQLAMDYARQAKADAAAARAESREAKAEAQRANWRAGILEAHDRLTTRWHSEHLQEFDAPALTLIKMLAPTEAARLMPKLKPFPAMDEAGE